MVVTINATDKHIEIFNSLNIPYEPVEKQPKPVHDMDSILKGVAEYFGKTSEDLFQKTREDVIVRPRQIAIYLQKKNIKLKWDEMAFYWVRPKETMRHSVRTIQNLYTYDKRTKNDIDAITDKLKLNP